MPVPERDIIDAGRQFDRRPAAGQRLDLLAGHGVDDVVNTEYRFHLQTARFGRCYDYRSLDCRRLCVCNRTQLGCDIAGAGCVRVCATRSPCDALELIAGCSIDLKSNGMG
jgi:hypothetical protein